jgi:hypothetical protein
MRPVHALLALAFATGCAAEEPPPEPPPPPPPPSFADFGGHWMVVNNLEGLADSVPSELRGNPDGTGWYMSLEGRDSIGMRASIQGDSLVLLSEKYESILRENVIVQVRTASVLSDGTLSGRLVATYDYPDSQQVVVGTLRGTRAP